MGKREKITLATFVVVYSGISYAVLRLIRDDVVGSVLLTVGFLTVYFSAVYKEIAELRKDLGDTRSLMTRFGPIGRAADKQALYPELSAALAATRARAYVTYFNRKAPWESANEEEKRYHTAMRDAIKRESRCAFRRIIAVLDNDTLEKIKWVREELELQKKYPDRYEIRFLTSVGELPYNVQVFDDYVCLVDPCRMNHPTDPRDIHTRDAAIAQIFKTYFEQHFTKCDTDVPRNYV